MQIAIPRRLRFLAIAAVAALLFAVALSLIEPLARAFPDYTAGLRVQRTTAALETPVVAPAISSSVTPEMFSATPSFAPRYDGPPNDQPVVVSGARSANTMQLPVVDWLALTQQVPAATLHDLNSLATATIPEKLSVPAMPVAEASAGIGPFKLLIPQHPAASLDSMLNSTVSGATSAVSSPSVAAPAGLGRR